MGSRRFLEQIADRFLMPAYADRLADIVFVFPNRRSGRFLKRYMQQRIKGTSFMPRFITVGAFISRLAGTPEASRRDCLFELYEAYLEAIASRGSAQTPRDFDRFIFWGEIILSDFEEIDRNAVNAEKLYANLSRLKEISADYLDEEQKSVVREIWGENAVQDSVGSFWRHISPDSDKDMTSQFLNLWELLGDIYTRFAERLHERGVATSGMQYREALRRVRTETAAVTAGIEFVFVGFNSPSVVETLIFDHLRSVGKAEFYWDTASPYIHKGSTAYSILSRLARKFPMPQDFELDRIDTVPDIDIIGVPSRTAQTKVACSLLNEWITQGYIAPDNAIGTAIILPDESLLMALLHSMPERLHALNITMGMPFANTAFAAMLRSVVSMQLRARRIRGEWRFFHEDIIEVLAHPHLRTAAAAEGAKLRRHIISNNLYTVEARELVELAPRLAFVFRAVDDANNISGVHGYLSGLVEGLHCILVEKAGQHAGWELEVLQYLKREIDDLAAHVAAHGIEAGERSYFSLFERALRTLTINMAGTPLKGLQIMNVAETRGLDFDNVIFLSVNERVFPRRHRAKTMIPNNLRAGYGLPPVDRAESEAAYYFYRLLGRAKRVALLYDSRDASSGSGEASRFITQLRYLHDAGNVRFRNISVGANPPEKRVLKVEKSESVMQRLAQYLEGGSSYLSASALKTYKHCPLKFYLQYVCGLRGEDNVTEYMTSAVYGTILHAVAQHIYDDYKGRTVSASVLTGLSRDMASRYTPLVEQLINKEYYHREAAPGTSLPVEGQIVRDLIIDFLSSMFAYERKAWCPTASDTYTYREGEMLVKGHWRITPDLTINFKMYIDRVDTTHAGLRFIDYKTGGDLIEVRSISRLFSSDDSRYDAILQILAYCEAYAAIMADDCAIQPVLYTFRTMDANGGILPLRIGGVDITDYHSVSAEFMPELQNLVCGIFRPDTPFIQAEEGSGACSYCIFAPMCGRVPLADE